MAWLPFGDQLNRIESKLDALTVSVNSVLHSEAALTGSLGTLTTKVKAMANELDTLTAQVTANTDAEASAVQLLQNLHDLLVAAGTDPTKLAAITSTLKTSGDALAAAVVANTPPTTP
jgi:hypothetical protein